MKKSISRFIFVLVLSLIAGSAAEARTIWVYGYDGQQQAKENVHSIQFIDGGYNLYTVSSGVKSLSMGQVKYIKLNDPASMEDLTLADQQIAVTPQGISANDAHLRLYTPAGALVAHGHGFIATASLPRGLYIVHAVYANGLTKSQKIMIP